MGGHAFPQPSTRLTTPQLMALAKYCSDRLTSSDQTDAHSSGLFKSVHLNRHLRLEDNHGDIDLLCEWDGANIAHLHGVRSGVLGEAVNEGYVEEIMRREIESKLSKEAVGRRGRISLGEVVLDRELVEERVRWSMGVWTMARGVCESLRAREWKFHWPVVHFAIPCRVLGGDHDVRCNGDEPFYQLDIFPAHPNKLELTKFLISYSHLHHILSQLLLLLSPAIWLRTTDLCFRHSPYLNQTRIEFKLSESRDQIFRWLGLDAPGYDQRIFADREELWTWLVDVEEKSLWGQAVMRFIDVVASQNGGSASSTSGSIAEKLFRGSHVIEDFSQWLLTQSTWSALTRDARASLSMSLASSTSTTASSVFDLSLTSPTPSPKTSRELDGESTTLRLNESLLRPPSPARLDTTVEATLAYFGMTNQYASCLEEQKGEAKEMAERKRWRMIMRDVRVEAHSRLMQANTRRREGEANKLADIMLAWLHELSGL